MSPVVAAVSVAWQRHGLVALDRSGDVIRSALLWNDTRSAQAAAPFVDEISAGDYSRRTGLVPARLERRGARLGFAGRRPVERENDPS